MKRFTLPLSLSALIILLVVGFSAFTHSLTAANISDRLFLVSLPLLLISGFLWVHSSGFFHLFQRSFQMKNKKQKKSEAAAHPSVLTFWFILTGMLVGASILFLLIALI